MIFIEEIESGFLASQLYQDFLSKLPAPFNNVYFDMLLLGILMVYLGFRVVDFFMMRNRHRKLKKRQEEVQRQNERERLLREEEAKVQQGKIAAFLQYIELRMKPEGNPSGTSETGWKGIGGRRMAIGSTHSRNDFEILMEEAKTNHDE